MENADTQNDPIDALLQRAEKAGFETERKAIERGDKIVVSSYISFPEGKDKRRVWISSAEHAQALQSIAFERFVFLSDYEAIADLDTGEIEAAISSRDFIGSLMVEKILGISTAISGDEEIDGSDVEEPALKAERPDGVRIEISKSTEELSLLALKLFRSSVQTSLSLKIFLGGRRNYNAALSALETVSNSLFFHLDLERGVALSLRKTIRRRRSNQRKNWLRKELSENINFPSFEYDIAPISLYWYARSARSMPLLQFLAYYQVAEYYFPHFSKLEAIRAAKKILKNPLFRLDKDSDVANLVSATSGNGRVGVSEREQLKATVLEALSKDELMQYFEVNGEVLDLVEKKHLSITEKTINLKRKDKDHDHRLDLAEMLYDIRCRIVHTKNDLGEFRSEMLLPFSTAEEELWPYIDLMRLVAQNTLIRSSSSLRAL